MKLEKITKKDARAIEGRDHFIWNEMFYNVLHIACDSSGNPVYILKRKINGSRSTCEAISFKYLIITDEEYKAQKKLFESGLPIIPSSAITVLDRLQSCVEQCLKLEEGSLTSQFTINSSKTVDVYPRHLFFSIAYMYLREAHISSCNYMNIRGKVARFNHSLAIHSCKTIKNRLEVCDFSTSIDVVNVCKMLKSNFGIERALRILETDLASMESSVFYKYPKCLTDEQITN